MRRLEDIIKGFEMERMKNIVDVNNDFEEKLFSEFGSCTYSYKGISITLLIITDTLNCLIYDKEWSEFIKNAEYDICLLLGDLSSNDVYEILKYVPTNKIYTLLGNHDPLNRFEEYGLESLHGKVIEVNGIKIAGFQGTFKYKNSDSALYTHEESIEIADSMPKADILVSHDRPFIKDTGDNTHDGLKGITEYIYKNNIPIEIHGHIHEESQEELKNGTKVICKYKYDLVKLLL